jgi:hypothetical protein
MAPIRLALCTPIAAAVVVLATGAPALAFHHVALPANTCGQSDFAGGANPTAVASIRENNPAQTLPLPPVGFDHAPVDRANCPSLRD